MAVVGVMVCGVQRVHSLGSKHSVERLWNLELEHSTIRMRRCLLA
jgi:hypothetical protein